mgnify:FL=1
MRSVTVIPASVNKFSAQPLSATEKRKVAAYARVSTDEEEQQSSYVAQCDYYERYIKSRADWVFVKVYADEGISGCNTRKREAFKAMVQDALDGKIQLILTKSVSRFARNTVDSLTTIRKLKEHGVEVWFEKENLKTFDPKVEMLLTILASLSQEESRSISENVNWGIRKKMTDGKFSLGYSHFLGYDKGADGSLVINEEEAKVIRRIYALYIKGMSPYGIAKVLTEEGIKTPGGKTRWSDSTVKSILRNEKYCGRALLQKTFTPDFLTKKTVKNTGQVPSYFVEHSHAPIIDPDVYDMVQRMMEGRKRGRDRISSVSIFSSKLRCGDCGSWYGSKTWHSTDKYKRVIWQCNHKFRGTKCSTPHFTEDEIKELFVRAVNLLLAEKEEIISTYEMMRDKLFSTTALVEERRALENELNVTARLVEDCIKENARIAQDQTAYEERYQSLVERYESAKKRYDEIVEQISDRTVRGEQVSIFLGKLREQDLIDTFDDDLWLSMVDFITVHDKSKVTVTFKDGSEIKLDR